MATGLRCISILLVALFFVIVFEIVFCNRFCSHFSCCTVVVS